MDTKETQLVLPLVSFVSFVSFVAERFTNNNR